MGMNQGSGDEGIDEAVQRVRAGDQDAFRVLIAACEQQLRILVAAILPQVSLVEDVVQKTLVIAYLRLDQYTLGTSFMSWVATIARYQALNERRRWLAEHSFKQRLRSEYRLNKDLYQHDDPGLLARDGLMAELRECMSGLRDRSAEIVTAYYLKQVPVAEIATRYGQSPDWVHLVLHRARRALRNCLLSKQGFKAHGS